MPKQTKKASGTTKGEALLAAVERIVDPPEKIEAVVDGVVSRVSAGLPRDATDEQIRRAVEQKLISDYSNRTALAGGASAMPSLIPGLGSLVSVLGGGLLDMTLCLKFEVEMVLALASARGYRITDPRERQLAYLLAAIHTYEASGGSIPVADLLKTEVDAVWNYSSRQLGKLVGSLFVKLALAFSGKSIARAVPFVGVVVGVAANKALTRRVGGGVVKALDERGARKSETKKKSAARAKPAKKPARKPPARKPAAQPRARRASGKK